MTLLAETLGFAPGVLLWIGVAFFVAGIVRGFTGFALSAVVMALGAPFVAPLILIPLLWWQELTASALLVRGSLADADKRVVLILVLGQVIGLPIGLTITKSIPVETSQAVALTLLIGMSAILLMRVRFSYLASQPGLYIGGLVAGIATGLANIGGMVIALIVLVRAMEPRQMRATLVLYLIATSISSFVWLTSLGVMTSDLVKAALMLAPVTALGVLLGKALFVPRWEVHYRPICLGLLFILSALGLWRVVQ